MERMVRISMLSLVVPAAFLVFAPTSPCVTITGIVKDAWGKPLENARIDHTGKIVVVAATQLALKPTPDEVRTDAFGHFHVLTNAPAIVVRMPGFESQRLPVTGDTQVQITLRRFTSASRCKLAAIPVFKTKRSNNADYSATWFYIETRRGREGIISGRGTTYSFGAPRDKDVWTSVEYTEIMYESGIVDASGHSVDGKYWRTRSIFGAASQYYGQNRETAEQLDCVMDRIPIEIR